MALITRRALASSGQATTKKTIKTEANILLSSFPQLNQRRKGGWRLSLRRSQVDFVFEALLSEGFSEQDVDQALNHALAGRGLTTRKVYDLAKSQLTRDGEELSSAPSAGVAVGLDFYKKMGQAHGNQTELEQPAVTLLWNTTPEGVLSANVGNYRVTVDRLLPAADARFVVRRNDSEAAVASGVRESTKEAMEQAEEVANRLLGIAVIAQPTSDRPSAAPL